MRGMENEHSPAIENATKCKGSWNIIRGRHTKKSPAYFDDWRCECGITDPYQCKLKFPAGRCEYGESQRP